MHRLPNSIPVSQDELDCLPEPHDPYEATEMYRRLRRRGPYRRGDRLVVYRPIKLGGLDAGYNNFSTGVVDSVRSNLWRKTVRLVFEDQRDSMELSVPDCNRYFRGKRMDLTLSLRDALGYFGERVLFQRADEAYSEMIGRYWDDDAFINSAVRAFYEDDETYERLVRELIRLAYVNLNELTRRGIQFTDLHKIEDIQKVRRQIREGLFLVQMGNHAAVDQYAPRAEKALKALENLLDLKGRL